jgi:hypothetical protein
MSSKTPLEGWERHWLKREAKFNIKNLIYNKVYSRQYRSKSDDTTKIRCLNQYTKAILLLLHSGMLLYHGLSRSDFVKRSFLLQKPN